MRNTRQVMKHTKTREVWHTVHRALIGLVLLALTGEAASGWGSYFGLGGCLGCADEADETILGYARFGVMLNLMRGSTNEYVAHGNWRIHPTKQWEEIQNIITDSPAHGVYIRGTYTDTQYNDTLGNIQQAFRRIVGKINDPAGWRSVKDDAEAELLTWNVGKTKPVKPYDHAAIKRHWLAFNALAESIDLTDEATRLKYAYHGIVASFSRGLVEPFENNKTYQKGPLGKATKKSPEFQDLRKCGNYSYHGLVRPDVFGDRQTYTFWMLKIRMQLVSLLDRLKKVRALGDVITFWEAALDSFNQVSLESHGELACFLDYGPASDELKPCKKYLARFRQKNRVPSREQKWNPKWWVADLYVTNKRVKKKTRGRAGKRLRRLLTVCG